MLIFYSDGFLSLSKLIRSLLLKYIDTAFVSYFKDLIYGQIIIPCL